MSWSPLNENQSKKHHGSSLSNFLLLPFHGNPVWGGEDHEPDKTWMQLNLGKSDLFSNVLNGNWNSAL